MCDKKEIYIIEADSKEIEEILKLTKISEIRISKVQLCCLSEEESSETSSK
jgi:hypothetical protein